MAAALSRKTDLLIDGRPIEAGMVVALKSGERFTLTGTWTGDGNALNVTTLRRSPYGPDYYVYAHEIDAQVALIERP
jgi:hypothetical protein